MDKQFYDGTKLLSLKDRNGKTPEIYVSTSNRSAGKTTWFNRYFVKRFLNHGEKFCLMYRYHYELDDVADKFFTDIARLFFKSDHMTAKRKADGVYIELELNNVSCGYAIAVNAADNVKKLSHLMSDAKRMLFDEFQPETGNYCPNEINKFQSVHTSLARGNGEQVRYLPVYMVSNFVTLMNPYYIAWDIADKLQIDTKYYRGNGVVLEQGFYQSAADAQLASGFNTAFSGSDYTKFAANKIYLNDRESFIEKLTGQNRYICTIVVGGKMFSLREYPQHGIIYCSQSVDESFPVKYCVETNDHNLNYVLLSQSAPFLKVMRKFFDFGCFRFQNLSCKSAVFRLLALTV